MIETRTAILFPSAPSSGVFAISARAVVPLRPVVMILSIRGCRS